MRKSLLVSILVLSIVLVSCVKQDDKVEPQATAIETESKEIQTKTISVETSTPEISARK